MLFNSYEFLFFFLPATIAVFFVLSGYRFFKAAAAWLALVSIFFYGYWNPRYVILLLASIAINFAAGHAILRYRDALRLDSAQRILVLAIVANLGALGCFKYANFFVNSINSVVDTNIALAQNLPVSNFQTPFDLRITIFMTNHNKTNCIEQTRQSWSFPIRLLSVKYGIIVGHSKRSR